MRQNSCQANLVSFPNSATGLVDEGNVIYLIYLDFSKAFNLVPYDTLKRKLEKCGQTHIYLSE